LHRVIAFAVSDTPPVGFGGGKHYGWRADAAAGAPALPVGTVQAPREFRKMAFL
jgi:hypothetical protein